MRRCMQKQLLELAASVWNGIKYTGSKGYEEEIGALLQECYSGINTISRMLRDGLSRVRAAEYVELLDYVKELLELLNEKVMEGSDDSGSTGITEIMDALNENMSVLCRELKHEPEVKIEIVFMPYKASMWDCFDSIWKAASNDCRCSVTVIPIPYYDKNPSGDLCNYYYEGDRLPEYVKSIPYQEYSIQLHRPDIVYIHNPYDGYNYVTSISPEYYSSELRKFKMV